MATERDPVGDLLRELGRAAPGDPLRAVEELVRGEPALAPRALDALLAALARTRDEEKAGLLALTCGQVRLASGDAKGAREQLTEAQGLLRKASPDAAARAALALARAEAALGDSKAARARLAQSLRALLEQGDDVVLGELEQTLGMAGDATGAEIAARLRRERRERGAAGAAGAIGGTAAALGDRIDVVARLAHALNSSLAGTAEPLYAILRATLDETGAQRGFIMLYAGGQLRFEIGLTRDGRTLGPEPFGFSSTVIERTLEEGKAVLVPDIERTLPFADASSARELGLRAALAAPLRVDRKRPGATRAAVALESVRGIAGVLYVDATTAASFGERDARFLETLADFAVISLRAARATTAPAAPAAAPSPPRARSGRRAPPQPAAPSTPPPIPGFVTKDPALLEVLRTLERAAPSPANVLLRGESGTGKELLARALHEASHRRGPQGDRREHKGAHAAEAPFVAVDCGAIPDELVHAELFGHEAHAFTGATNSRPGLIEQADGGTLFLDEVGDASPAFQAALLRTLQEGEVRRLGGDASRPVRVRIVSATNRDLRALVEAGVFRHDLLFRIAAIELKIPPLRERDGDVSLLVAHFLEKQEGAERRTIDADALARLEEHGWPGNVRELENAIAAATVMTSGEITLAAVDQVLASARSAPPRVTARGEGPETLEAIEKRAISERLDRFGWNQVQAAASLGIDRNTLRRKVVRYGIVRGRD